jgi:hypothetical protein
MTTQLLLAFMVVAICRLADVCKPLLFCGDIVCYCGIKGVVHAVLDELKSETVKLTAANGRW